MRLSVRLNLSLVAGVTLVSVGIALYQTQSETSALRRDLERHAALLAESLEKSAAPLMAPVSPAPLQVLVNAFQNRQRLAGVAIYNEQAQPIAASSGLAARLEEPPRAYLHSRFFRSRGQLMHVYALPVVVNGAPAGTLALFHDAAYIEARQRALWKNALTGLAMQAALIICLTLLILQWSLRRPLRRLTQWLGEVRRGSAGATPELPPEDSFGPLSREVAQLATTLHAARAAAQEEARLRDAGESQWTAERLRAFVESRAGHCRIFAISNREPYEHIRNNGEVKCSIPASGLVTALEPILRSTDGTWIAQGTGSADRETVDARDHIRVPPDSPQYTLRRVWLTEEEERGFYLGFVNEGLWPLCHIAHTRPLFRAQDWDHYQAVNRRFADAFLEEAAGEANPLVLVQDYHFALVPRMIKESRPDARVAIFWHIPWPNPEAFGICPWQRELLDGLLGADLIGFHIQSHCNNFLETVDRALESRIDRERFAVTRHGHLTLVRPFPISVDFHESPEGTSAPASTHSIYLERSALFRELGVQAAFMGVGVDRVDYTKGILERFRGIERFIEKYPSYRGKFTFVQIGAPSRTHIKRYHDLLADVESEADRINWRFQTAVWRPIVFLKRHHSHQEIERYYKAADVCMVTSLHEGMNLVAKEFVASRDDEQGALILSRFTGAAREMRDALIVNPYDTEQLANAIFYALEMDPEERSARMRRMRRVIKDHNVYRWAANLISELSEVRIERIEPVRIAQASSMAR